VELNDTFEPESSAIYGPDLAPPAKIRKPDDESSTFSKDSFGDEVSVHSVCTQCNNGMMIVNTDIFDGTSVIVSVTVMNVLS